MRPTYPIHKLLTSLLISLSMVAGFSTARADELPELGDGATQYLTPQEERQIGQSFLRQLIRDPDYLDDPEIRHYLQSLGDHIGKSADLRGTPLTFNLVKSPDLNAFAVPGGFITFNSGLLLYTEEESELASVVAHEIAHLSQLHLPRLIAQSEKNKLPTAAAIIGSILLGGQVGLAGLTLTNAKLLSDQLRYTRGFEREADAIGMQLLRKSGFDTKAMARFFHKLQRYSQSQSGDLPEFLRTHPLSYNRIAEAELRSSKAPDLDLEPNLDFALIRAKIQSFHIPKRENAQDYFKDRPESTDMEKLTNRYGLASALFYQHQYQEAKSILAPLLDTHPEIRSFSILMAELEQALGESDQAVDRLVVLYERDPSIAFIDDYVMEAMIRAGQYQQAKKRIRYQIRRSPQRYELYKKLSRANVKLNLLSEAHQADAEYHLLLGSLDKAIGSLELALREEPNEGYLRQSISARLKELKTQQSYKKN